MPLGAALVPTPIGAAPPSGSMTSGTRRAECGGAHPTITNAINRRTTRIFRTLDPLQNALRELAFCHY